MREIIARLVTVLTVAVVVGLSLLFAAKHNPRAAAGSAPPAVAAVPLPAVPEGEMPRPLSPKAGAPGDGQSQSIVARGREVYAQQNCAACHSIAGEGSPRAPLDDVGERHHAADLRAWITGTGAAVDVLAPATVRRKQRYQNVPAGDLDALIAYLSTLKSAK